MADVTRPLPPTNIKDWAKSIEKDVDASTRAVDGLRTNVETALQTGTASAASVALLNAQGQRGTAAYAQDIAFAGSGWLPSTSRPSLRIVSPTGQLRIQYGGQVRNGSARFAYSITAAGSSIPQVDRNQILDDTSRALPVTGFVSFPACAYRTEVIQVAANVQLTVTLEIYGEAAGVIFSGGSLLVEPSI